MTLQENIFNNARPQLVVTESGKYVMVRVSAVAGRAVGNNTAVVYSVWDAASKTWSVPVILDDDGTADFDPSVAVRGENVLVTWSNATNSSFTPESSLSEVAASCGIKAALLNVETGAVSNIGAFYDGEASMSSSAAFDDNGNAAVAWITNGEADVLELSGTNTVRIAQLVDGQWTQSAYASVDLPVSEVALGQYADALHVAYAVASSNENPDDDDVDDALSVYVGAIGASPTLLRGCTERATCLDFRTLGQSGVLAWREGSDLQVSYALGSSASMGELSGADFDFTRMGESDYIVYSSSLGTDGNKTALYARPITADGLGDELSVPLKKDNTITGYSVAPYGQGMMVAMAATDAVVGANSIDGSTNLEMAIVNGARDVSIRNAKVQPSCNVYGSVFLKVSFEVENSGLLPSCVRARIKVGDETCADGLVSARILPGGWDSYCFEQPISTQVLEDTALSIELSPADDDGQKMPDFFPDDNSVELPIGFSDLVAVFFQCTNGDIDLSIANQGSLPTRSHVVVSSLSSNEVIFEADTHSLFAGNGWDATFSPSELLEKVSTDSVLKVEMSSLDVGDCDLSNNVTDHCNW